MDLHPYDTIHHDITRHDKINMDVIKEINIRP